MQQHFDLLIDTFLHNDVGIDTSFLNEKLSKGLQQNIKDLENDDKMIPAGIGNNEVKNPDQKMRGDTIYWMDKSHDNIFEQEFLQLAEDFIAHLNNTCYTGINDYEFHYAVYGEGSFYKRHLDQFKNDEGRKYSLISYLNDNWQAEDGGQLVLHHEKGQQDISPAARTTVFFKSNELEHEVILANRRRMSISGWLKSN